MPPCSSRAAAAAGVESLYEGSSAAHGYIGPPFQAVFFAPFAAIGTSARWRRQLLWHVAEPRLVAPACAVDSRGVARGARRLDCRCPVPELWCRSAACCCHPDQLRAPEHEPAAAGADRGATWLLSARRRAGIFSAWPPRSRCFRRCSSSVLRGRWRAAGRQPSARGLTLAAAAVLRRRGIRPTASGLSGGSRTAAFPRAATISRWSRRSIASLGNGDG